MATKKEQLEAKLGSWTDQASLTRGHAAAPAPETAQTAAQSSVQSAAQAAAHGAAQGAATPIPDSPPVRSVYTTERGLLDRINALAAANGLSQNEAIGHLLTWALDQADSGAYHPQ